MKPMVAHHQDEDCTRIDPETQLCRDCGVDHSNECPDCKGRGFHRPRCYWTHPALLCG